MKHDPFMYLGRFVRIHIPSGRIFQDSKDFLSRSEFLHEMQRWNNQQPNVWAYHEENERLPKESAQNIVACHPEYVSGDDDLSDPVTVAIEVLRRLEEDTSIT